MISIFKFLKQIFSFSEFRRQTEQYKNRLDWWRETYQKMRLRGDVVSEDDQKSAENLGLDVVELTSEHRRMLSERRWIAIDLDLASIKLNNQGRPLDDQFREWETEIITLGEKMVEISLPGVGIWEKVSFSDIEVPISEILKAGVNLIIDKFERTPSDFKHTLPHGLQDLKIDELRGSVPSNRWTLVGERKAELLGQTVAKLFPTRSIELVRGRVENSSRIKVQPWPELDHIYLTVSRWPSGKQNVLKICESRDQCGPEYQASFEGQPDTIIVQYPCDGTFRWESTGQPSPAVHFLKKYTFLRVGSLAEKLRDYEVGAVLCDFSKPIENGDYRASLKSGDCGPAPLPRGHQWPSCAGCAKPQIFVGSIDFRDVPFAQLLPGSSIVIFMCTPCVHQGNYSECSSLVWLPNDLDIEFVSNGPKSPLVEARQWLGHDYSEMPEPLEEELRDNWPSDLPWFGSFFSHATKAGGVPDYLQGEEPVFDSSGNRMEYIGQFIPSEKILDGYGYLLHSTKTGETVAILQTT
jgi:hypothetical protein